MCEYLYILTDCDVSSILFVDSCNSAMRKLCRKGPIEIEEETVAACQEGGGVHIQGLGLENTLLLLLLAQGPTVDSTGFSLGY